MNRSFSKLRLPTIKGKITSAFVDFCFAKVASFRGAKGDFVFSTSPLSSVRKQPTSFWWRCLLMLLLIPSTLSINVGCNFRAQGHNVTGRQAFEQGQFAVAINEFQRALTANPVDADAYHNLGSSYYALGKQSNNQQWIKQAEELFRRAISINDRHVPAHRSLAGLLIETNQEKYAFDLINAWKDRYPTSTEPIVELARLYQEYGDNRRATDLLADALKLDSTNIRALKAMGHVREIQGQTHLALDNYLRVLQFDPQQVDVAARVASLQSRLAQLPVGGNVTSPNAAAPSRYGAIDPYATTR